MKQEQRFDDCRVMRCTVTVVVPYGRYPDRLVDKEGSEFTVLDWYEEDLEFPSQMEPRQTDDV